jgi:hypothetical protein
MKIRLLLFVMLICVAAQAFGTCTTLQSGLLKYSPGSRLAGQPIPVGFDLYGYNYQGHMFLGSYFNAYANVFGYAPYFGDDAAYLAENPNAATYYAWEYRTITVEMKWNEAWLSNKDCNGDLKLDRPDDNGGSYRGSGAWITNHMSDVADGVHWTDFVKMIATPADAHLVGGASGMWYTSDNIEIGQDLNWGDGFAIIQEVYNDPAEGFHGVLSKSPVNPGFGYWMKNSQ